MKTIAIMALTPGMEIGADVFNYKNELVVPAGTKVDADVISKLGRHSIVSVPVKEAVDFAVTYFEKVRFSSGFQKFRDTYQRVLPRYREMMRNLAYIGLPLQLEDLMGVYQEIASSIEQPESLLDYLYNMLPTEDDLSYVHCLNSALIAGLFASWLSLSAKERDILIQCGFFYDIGKLKLPNSLIWKPGKLTDQEFEKIKDHNFLAFQMLQPMLLDSDVYQAALMHHERYDGSGYPSGLKGTQINLYARYITIIDAYEAMTSARSWRKAKNPFEVLDIFEKDYGKYDPELLKPIMYRIANHMIGLKVILNNNQVAEVSSINQEHMGRPMLRCENGTIIDLVARRDLIIQELY